MYILNLDENFAPFLRDGVTWLQKMRDPNDTRGFQDDMIPDDREHARHGDIVPDPTACQQIKRSAT